MHPHFTEILPGLWLGNIKAAEELQETLSLTHLLSCGVWPEVVKEAIVWATVDIEDCEEQDLTSHLDSSVAFIKNAVDSNGVILVHC